MGRSKWCCFGCCMGYCYWVWLWRISCFSVSGWLNFWCDRRWILLWMLWKSDFIFWLVICCGFELWEWSCFWVSFDWWWFWWFFYRRFWRWRNSVFASWSGCFKWWCYLWFCRICLFWVWVDILFCFCWVWLMCGSCVDLSWACAIARWARSCCKGFRRRWFCTLVLLFCLMFCFDWWKLFYLF